MIEVLTDNKINIPVKRIGVNYVNGYCYKYGGGNCIDSLYGLDKNSIVEAILNLNL